MTGVAVGKGPSAIEFLVTGDPSAARSIVEGELGARKFRLTWQDAWTLTAERGSKAKNYLLGGLVKYLRVGVGISTGQDAVTVVRVEPESSGNYGGGGAWEGRIVGNQHMEDELAALRDDLRAAFTSAGTLRDVREG